MESTIIVGKQDFIKGMVKIEDAGKIYNCPMYIDNDGDILFIYSGRPYYFRYIDENGRIKGE